MIDVLIPEPASEPPDVASVALIERIKQRAQSLRPSRTVEEVDRAVAAAKREIQESEDGERLIAAVEKLLK